MPREITGRHVLIAMLVFFGVTIAVNAVFITQALETFTGEDVSQPYVKGLQYNETLAERAAQSALGWNATIDATRDASGATALSASLHDGNGKPLSGLSVSLTLQRPTDSHLDQTLTLSETAVGAYATTIPDLAPGQWDAIITTAASDGTKFEARRRLWLR